MLRPRLLTSTVLLIVISAPTAFAGGAQSGGVKVGGKAEQSATVLGGIHTGATGIAADATTRVGTISDSQIDGQFKQSTFVAGVVSTNALGIAAEAETDIGVTDRTEISGNATQDTTVLGGVSTSTHGCPSVTEYVVCLHERSQSPVVKALFALAEDLAQL